LRLHVQQDGVKLIIDMNAQNLTISVIYIQLYRYTNYSENPDF